MKIGLTGGRGVLGKIATQQFSARGHNVDLYPDDICDLPTLQKWVREWNGDALLHFAAIVPTHKVKENPSEALRVNVGGTIHLLSALASLPKKPWFFYASSSHVYQSSPEPLREDAIVNPHNSYGVSKRISEQCVETVCESLGVPWCIGRIFSFYHSDQKGSFLYPTLQQRFASEDLSQPFLLHGMNDVRDLSLADLLVEKIVLLTENQSQGIINIGSGKGTRIADFVQSIAPQPLKIISASDAPSTSLVADISKLKQKLNK